jgi:hypothetical protein
MSVASRRARTADPTRTTAVRRWAASLPAALRAFACGLLLTLGDRESAALLAAQQRTAERGTLDVAGLARVGGPEALAFLREIANDEERAYGGDQGAALEALAHAAGWPANAPLDLEAFPEASRDAVRGALIRGDLASSGRVLPRSRILSGASRPPCPWKCLATQGLRRRTRSRRLLVGAAHGPVRLALRVPSSTPRRDPGIAPPGSPISTATAAA